MHVRLLIRCFPEFKQPHLILMMWLSRNFEIEALLNTENPEGVEFSAMGVSAQLAWVNGAQETYRKNNVAVVAVGQEVD